MSSEDNQQGSAGPPDAASRAGTSQPGMSRRAALGRISAGAALGTTAWVIPQIMTAKPAAGATLSGPPATLAGTTGAPNFPVTTGTATDGGAPSTLSNLAPTGTATDGGVPSTLSNLATTGLDLQRDAEIGAAMIAVGWALHRWASRSAKVATRPAAVQGEPGIRGQSA
jgi:hypothetical protein